MPTKCSTWKCPNIAHCMKTATGPRVYYYSLEVIARRNPDRFDEFMKTIGYTGNLEHLKYHVICSAHFAEDAFEPFELTRVANSSQQVKLPPRAPKLRHDAWPTLNLVKIPECNTSDFKRRRMYQDMEESRNVQYYISQESQDPYFSLENTLLLHTNLLLVQQETRDVCSSGGFVAFEHVKLDPMVDMKGLPPIHLGGPEREEELKDIIPSQCHMKLEHLEDRILSQQVGGTDCMEETVDIIPLPEHHIKSEPLEEMESHQGCTGSLDTLLLAENIKSEQFEEIESLSGDMECVGGKEAGIISQEYHIKLEPLEDEIPSQQIIDMEERDEDEIRLQQYHLKLKPMNNLISMQQVCDPEFMKDDIPSQKFVANSEHGISSQEADITEHVKKVGYEIPSYYIKIEEQQMEDRIPSQLTDTEFLDLSKVTESNQTESTFETDPLQIPWQKSYLIVYSNKNKNKTKSAVGDLKEKPIVSNSDAKHAENNEKTAEESKEINGKKTDTTDMKSTTEETCVNNEEQSIASCSDTKHAENNETTVEENKEIDEIKIETTDIKSSTKEVSVKKKEHSIPSCSKRKHAENNEKTVEGMKTDTTVMKLSTVQKENKTLYGSYMCLICYTTDNEIPFHQFKDFSDHLDTHVETSFKICDCSKKCISINDYYSHLRFNRCTKDINFTGYVSNVGKVKSDTQWLMCKYDKYIQCSECVPNYCNIEMHERHVHFCVLNDIKHSILLMATYYRCPICNVTFKDQDLFYAHCTSPLLFPESLNFCTKCLLSFESKQAYTAHMQTEGHVLECQLCHISSVDVVALIHHKTHEHNVRKVYCSGCSETLSIDEFMYVHVYVCFKVYIEQPFVCPLCGVICEYFNELMLHLKIEMQTLKNAQFQCRKCHNYFCSKFNLSCHMVECGQDTSVKIEASQKSKMALALEQPCIETCKFRIATKRIISSVGQNGGEQLPTQ